MDTVSVSVEWLDQEKTLILAKVEGRPENQEYFDADAQLRAMLESVAHSVDLIQDLSKLAFFRSSYSSNMDTLRSFARPNMRSVIFVGNHFAWEIFEAYVRQHGGTTYQYAFAETLEDAYTLISRVRSGKSILPSRPASPDWN